MHASTPPAVREWDLRNVPTSNTVARKNLPEPSAGTGAAGGCGAAGRRVAPGADARIGELWAISGFTYILFGELYCSGVPISPADPLTYGAPLSTTQLLDTALVV